MTRKILLSLLLVIGVSVSSVAQVNNRGKFSINADAGIVINHNYYSGTYGGALSYKWPVGTNTAVTASAGYTALSGNALLSTGSARQVFSAIPLKAGFRYYLKGGLYGEAQLGAAIGTKAATTSFLYTPGLGYDFDGGFGLGLRYEAWMFKPSTYSSAKNLSQIVFRLLYSF